MNRARRHDPVLEWHAPPNAQYSRDRVIGILAIAIAVCAWGIATVAGSGTAPFAALPDTMRACSAPNPSRFEQKIWFATFPCDHRRAMVDDLKANYLKVGMAREDVVRLLGVPDISYYAGAGDPNTIEYHLDGQLYGTYLEIDFDAAWRLTEVHVLQNGD